MSEWVVNWAEFKGLKFLKDGFCAACIVFRIILQLSPITSWNLQVSDDTIELSGIKRHNFHQEKKKKVGHLLSWEFTLVK